VATAPGNADNFRAALDGLNVLESLIPGFDLNSKDVAELLGTLEDEIRGFPVPNLQSIVEGLMPTAPPEQVESVLGFLRLATSLENLFNLIDGGDLSEDVTANVTNAVAKLSKVTDFVETVDNFNVDVRDAIADDLEAIKNVAAG
jgi:hypothetical protein